MSRTKPEAARLSLPLTPALPARDSAVFPGMIHTLHVVREGSRRAVRAALSESKPILVVSQRDVSVEDPRPAELYRVGCLCEALQAVPLPDGSLRVALRGIRRAEALRYQKRGGVLLAAVAELEETSVYSDEVEAMMRACREGFGEIIEKGRRLPNEAFESVVHQVEPGAMADAIAHHLPLRIAEKQSLLEDLDAVSRLERIHSALRRELRLLHIQSEISQRVDREFATAQREFFLREQLQAIQSELEALGESSGETTQLRMQIEEAEMPAEAKDRALAELARLERTPSHSPEGIVIRSYLDWMISLPWSRTSPDRLDVQIARRELDAAHFGLDTVKDRILDFLAVRQLNRSLRGPILCFVGPPGVGKTSVGRSIADALGREFVRISLGGIRDEAEIRGHRRTYVGALPGRILQSLRQCGTRNPVMVLDEIDKMSSDFRGDPSSALLEALDPAQNDRFSDHYLETPFDLSAVLFIATANLAGDIPYALRDRLEIVHFSSYTAEERYEIGRKFIVPRQTEAHGLDESRFILTKPALQAVVQEYTREAGVRELERTVGSICRKAARKIAEGGAKRIRVDRARLESMIGQARFPESSRPLADEVGQVMSLVVTEYGGEAIPIEAVLLEPCRGGPELRLTGNMGEVMKESAEAALSFARSVDLGVANSWERDVHIHFPENSVPKEGPSAGLAIAVALASAASGRKVRGDLAITGEITLRGKLLAVGGIREKLVAAHRAGIRTVILPAANKVDLADVPPATLRALEVRLMESAEEALRAALVETPAMAAVRLKTGRS